MSLDTIAQIIGSVGFPIVIALLAAWYIKYLGDKNGESMREMNQKIIDLSDKQNQQLDKMTDSITEVQKALAALTYTIQRREDRDDGK